MHLVAKRRLAAVALALIASAALAVTAFAGHWPMFGGDAGHSGYQPVDEGGLPVKQRYAQTDITEQNIKTSVVATAGGALVFGTHVAAGDARAHVQNLADGTPVGPQPGVDVDDAPVNDTDSFTGNAGSVTPIDTSSATQPGVELFLHNDDDQQGAGTLGNGATDPRTGGDIALAAVDPATGFKLFDQTIGGQDPAGEETINMRVSGSPVLGPVLAGAPPVRELFFIAERVAATVDPVATQTPCNPNASFDVVGAGGVRGCNVPAERRLFKVAINDPGTVNAAIEPGSVRSVVVTNANLDTSPTHLRLTDTKSDPAAVRSYVAVGTDDGLIRTFRTDDLSAGPATGNLGGPVTTPVVPVKADGSAADVDPPIYVASGTTTFKAYEIRRLDPPPATGPLLGMLDPTRDQSPTNDGAPGVAGAVSAAADQMQAGGRFVVPADRNLYSFDVNDLRNGNALELSASLASGTTGFSRTVPALQGPLVYIARDNGEQLVLEESTLDPAEGFESFADADGRAAGDGIGQPAITRGFVAFGQQDGLFVYRNENAPIVTLLAPADGATLTGTVTLRATAYNLRSGIARLQFELNETVVGEGTLVSGSPTSSSNPGVYELTFDSKTFGNGLYSLRAVATDNDSGPDAPAESAASAPRTVTVINESPTQLAVSDVDLIEGDSGTREATFTVTKTGPNATTVTASTKAVSATAGQDYDDTTQVLKFGPGEGSQTFTVVVRGDTVDETDETFTVLLSDPTGGASVADGSGLGIIRDDDASGPGPNDPVVSISSASIAEGGPRRTRRMTFDVSLSRPAPGAVTVAYATADQTAQAPGDYRSTAGTLTFAAGQLTTRFTVPVLGDDLVEGNEVFLVRLSNVVGAGLGNAVGTGQIVDDEVARSARVRPSQLTMRLKPRRDARSPYRFTSSGNLILPAGVSPLAACQGRVAVQVKAGRKTISNRRVAVRSNCTFRSRVTFRDRARFPSNGRLTFRARFLGNGLLLGKVSRRVVARTR